MKILFAIAHYFHPQPEGAHGSEMADPKPRLVALSECIAALHQVFGESQFALHFARRGTVPANQGQAAKIEVVVCTTAGRHLLDRLLVPPSLFTHVPTPAQPLLLGYECQAVLRDRLGHFDYYCFLEDDLILRDSWFFLKLAWFNQQVGNANLLQPNRYEVSFSDLAHKVYVDGVMLPQATTPFQNAGDQPEISGPVFNVPVKFQRTLNPHAGCFFLNAEQMACWARQPYFLDRATSFIGPLESAATLGIMRTFRIYKPAMENAGFLEIQHFGNGFLSQAGRILPFLSG
jgi:hypothetical protein